MAYSNSPAYTSYQKDAPTVAKQFKFCLLGCLIHLLAGFGSLFGILALSLAIIRSTSNTPIQSSLLFVAFCTQIALSLALFSKSFFTWPRLRFIRHAFGGFIPTLFTAWIGIRAATELISQLFALVAAPFAYLIVYAPYYYYLSDECSWFSPFIAIKK